MSLHKNELMAWAVSLYTSLAGKVSWPNALKVQEKSKSIPLNNINKNTNHLNESLIQEHLSLLSEGYVVL